MRSEMVGKKAKTATVRGILKYRLAIILLILFLRCLSESKGLSSTRHQFKMHDLPIPFVQNFVTLMEVNLVTFCLHSDLYDEADEYADFLGRLAGSLSRQANFVTASHVLDQRPVTGQTTLVVCQKLDKTLDYRERRAFDKSVAWLLSDETSDGTGFSGLRLDSRVFTYTFVNSSHNIILNELFRVKDGPIKRQFYGKWTTEDSIHQEEEEEEAGEGSLKVPQLAMWERRTDLSGVILVDTVLEWKPFLILDNNGNFALTTGAMADFLKALQSSLNFTVHRYSPVDKEWGFLYKNATHQRMSGLVGELHREKADLCTAGLYVTRERQEFADMLGVISDYSTLIVPRSLGVGGTSQMNTMAYVRVFSEGTWFCVLITVIILAAFFMFMGLTFAKNQSVIIKKKDTNVFKGFFEGIQVLNLKMLSNTVHSYCIYKSFI